jgi:hypothetical protein
VAIGTVIGLAAMLCGSGSWAQQRVAAEPEIAPFRLIGIEGYAIGRYWWDSNDNVTGNYSTNQTLSNLSGEFFVLTHSYIYHPNLLLLDLGAGPVIYRQGYSSNGVNTTSNKATYNLTARATFLRDKPYRGDLYFERKNDSQPVGPAQSLLTENTRYGFDFALLAPVTPMPIRVDASRFQSQGKGTEQVINDRVNDFNFRIDRSWGKLGETNFHYEWMQDDSQSGSPGLPIQATTSRNGRTDLDTSLNFGANNEYTLTNTVTLNKLNFTGNLGTIADTRLFRFDVNLQGRPTDKLQTRARYQFDALDQTGQSGTQSGRLNALDAGVTYQASPDLSGTLDATATHNRNTSFTASAAAISGSVNYRYALPLGEVTANLGSAYVWRDQNAEVPVVQVVGERLVLSGTNWVPLRHPQVIVSTIVVSNAPRTQSYVEGVDYALREIGLTTQIQRQIGGNILDGQEVLVDYEYNTGGTYALNQFDNSVSLNWNLQNYGSVYFRYVDASPRLISGMPTAPLNPITDVTYGARADIPLNLLTEQIRLGGYAEWEDRREVISPYRRTTYQAYVDTSLPLLARGGLRLAAQRQNTEYANQPEQNVDETTYNVRLWSRFRTGLELSIEGTRTRDTGSPLVAREYTNVLAKAQWRVRRFLMTLDFGRTRESQGISHTTHTTGEFRVRRDF